MITATDAAVTQIKQLIEKRNKGVGIRIGVKTTGCSGMAYMLEYLDEQNYEPGVIDYTVGGVIIRVGQKDLPYLENTQVDFVTNGLNKGFEFINPNERDRCGCGESFRV